MQPIRYLYPNGGKRAATFSYDDGRPQDRRLVDLFSRYGLKATFHLNAAFLDTDGYISAGEVKPLYDGHEVASHTTHHPFLSQQPNEAALAQIMEDRATLERLVGCPVRGFSYPFGDAGGAAPALLRAAGIDYARTTEATQAILWPDDFMLWHPTCHHKRMEQAMAQFQTRRRWHVLTLLYVWGHSYEFDNDGNWQWFETQCAALSAEKDVWFATNNEAASYITAVRGLKWGADCKTCVNPSALTVLIEQDGQPLPLKPGLTRLP